MEKDKKASLAPCEIVKVLQGWRKELDAPKGERRSRDQYLQSVKVPEADLEFVNGLIDRGLHLGT